MKTADLIGADLDEWVARAEGHILRDHPTTLAVWRNHGDGHPEFLGFLGAESAPPIYSPSTSPAQGQPIMEREDIASLVEIGSSQPFRWVSAPCRVKSPGIPDVLMRGPTMLIAGMRARVAQVYGDEVSS